MPPEPNRLFFALWPDDATRAACATAARELKVRMQPSGYLIRPERLHLTLLFLGDAVPADKERAAIEAASKLRAAPFALRMEKASAFNAGDWVWWLGPRETPAALTALYDGLKNCMRSANVPVDRMRFTPHLSVVRTAGKPLATTMIKPIDWAVKEFVLIRSVLDQRPGEYQILGRWTLDNQSPLDSQPGQLNLWEH